jgi:biopolymer transport protein ExbB/TolQ
MELPFIDLLLNSGPVVKGVLLVLILASVASWAIAFEKLFRIAAFSKLVSGLTTQGGHTDNWLAERFLAIASAEPAPKDETRADYNARLERSLQTEASEQLQRLQSGLPFLATVGSTSPFIGLFGTVWGIMHSFSGIAANRDTSLATVAPGIAEALFATAIGLAAAIPAVLFYNQANIALTRLASRLSAAVAAIAKERAYALSFNNAHATGKAERGLTDGIVRAQ